MLEVRNARFKHWKLVGNHPRKPVWHTRDFRWFLDGDLWSGRLITPSIYRPPIRHPRNKSPARPPRRGSAGSDKGLRGLHLRCKTNPTRVTHRCSDVESCWGVGQRFSWYAHLPRLQGAWGKTQKHAGKSLVSSANIGWKDISPDGDSSNAQTRSNQHFPKNHRDLHHLQ